MIFRTAGAATKSISQALAIAGVLVLAIVIYTGFTIPRPKMHPWFEWISYINPVYYAFEGMSLSCPWIMVHYTTLTIFIAVLINEIHGRSSTCGVNIVPYPFLFGSDNFICSTSGAVAGQTHVSGDAWPETSYAYSYVHIWRNLGILLAFLFFFLVVYLVTTETNAADTSETAGVLVYRKGHSPSNLTDAGASEESQSPERFVSQQGNAGNEADAMPPQKDIFTWDKVTYEIPMKGSSKPRRLLDNVTGWVAPGTLTALMGVSGAGKITLLDVLPQRTSIGVVTGDMLVNAKPLGASFQRSTGYVQQQDLHLETTTVREALRFSAVLRQPKSTPTQEKYEFVEEVI